MKLTLAEPRFLKDSISIISELVNEATFKIKQDAIEMVAMDPANVAMVIFKLLSSSFIEYNVTAQKEIAINLNNLKQILRRAKPNDMVTLQMDNEQSLKIILKGTTTRTFSIPIIELDEKEQKIPDLNFSSEVMLPNEIFNEAIEDANIVGEAVTFIAEDKKFTVSAEGDLSNAKIEIKEDENILIKTDITSTTKAKYSIEYLKKMVGGSKIADKVTIYFSKNYPLKLEYKTVDRVLMSFILAPRVDNE